MPRVVFVTAYDEYALRAFEVQAFDYLLKPVVPSRFALVLERARAELRRATAGAEGARLEALLQQLAPAPRYLQRLLVEQHGRARLLAVAELLLVEAERNYVRLSTAGGDSFLQRGALGALLERLDPAEFLQLNRSQVVRLDAVRELQPWFHGDWKVVLKDGRELRWSRRYRARRGADFRA
jgi:two-component system LytT family response regulator